MSSMTHETRENNDGWLTRAAARCYGRVVLPTDTHEERVFKRTMLIFWGIIFCLNVPQLFREYESFWYTFAEFLLFVITSSSLMYCFITRTVPRALAEAYIVVCCLFVLIPLDLNSARQLDERNWPLIIVCLDVALVLDMRRRVPYLVLAGLIPYLWLVSLNSAYNFGFTRDPIVSWEMPVVCDCARPPCEYSLMKSFFGGLSHVCALVLDFYFTRRFATIAKKEKQVMQSSIDTAGDLAVRLSRLDLKGAQDVLDTCLAGEGEAGVAMPAELRAAFADILSNLRVYKPYLPLSCLPEHAREATHEDEMEVSQSSRHSSANSKCSHESVSRHSSHSSFPHPAAMGAVHHQQKPRWKRATLMQTNMHRTLRGDVSRESEASIHVGQEQVAIGFAASLTALLTRLLVLVSAQGGVVDLFVGDRVWSSFNTSRLLAKHAHGAVRACTTLLGADGSHSLNAGLACGRVMCGDLGCDTMRRYTVLGHVPLLTCALERIGRGLDVAMLCNEQLMRDIRDEHDVRLVPRTVHFVKLGREEDDFGGQLMSSKYVYELLPRSEVKVAASPRQGAEWMYELVDIASHVWDTHDACVRAYLAGASIEEALKGCSDDDADMIRVQLTNACASRSPFKYKF